MTWRATVLLWGLVASTAFAQGRPDEDALFGPAPDAGTPGAQAPPPSNPSMAPGAGTEPDRSSPAGEQQILTGAPAADAFASGLVKDDALKIGGQFYMRSILSVTQGQGLGKSSFSVPTLLDVYLDARPTDRLRAFVLGRLTYDPLLNTSEVVTGVPASSLGLTTASNPAVYLDQAWLTFDIARSAFVTAGRQHVKWGTGVYFNPDDFLASQPRDPLAVFDARLGVSMLRVQVPWEKTGLTFTAVAVFEPTQNVSTLGTTIGGSSGSVNLTSGTATTSNGLLNDVGGAGQIEYDFKGGAVGVNALAQRNRAWRTGSFVTAGIGDLDVYGEAVLKQCLDFPNMPTNATCAASGAPDITVPPSSPYRFGPLLQPPSPIFQAVAGLSYGINFEGNKSITLGAEYFFNTASFQASQYPNLIFQGYFQPFYLGRNYLVLSATLTDTTAKTTWVLTNIGDLSDRSFITRVDFIITVLSYLQVESYASVDYGHRGGEFRLGFDIPGVSLDGSPSIDVSVPAPILQLGLGLRLAL